MKKNQAEFFQLSERKQRPKATVLKQLIPRCVLLLYGFLAWKQD